MTTKMLFKIIRKEGAISLNGAMRVRVKKKVLTRIKVLISILILINQHLWLHHPASKEQTHIITKLKKNNNHLP